MAILAFAHYARVIRRGARRFSSVSSAADLQQVAFENPDGQQVLVVTNKGPARTIQLQLANMTASVPLKVNSLTTLAGDNLSHNHIKNYLFRLFDLTFCGRFAHH